MITATIAGSYNKDVFAFPGNAGEALAEGGNGLIKQNKAALIENAEDLLYAMQWQEVQKKIPASRQIPLLLDLSEEEKIIMDLFGKNKSLRIDEICQGSGLTMGRVSSLLLQLEFMNLLRSRPGKTFEAI